MGPTDRRGRTGDGHSPAVLARTTTLAVVAVMVVSVTAGVATADAGAAVQQEDTNDTYAVVQGNDCTEISPLTGNESVTEFYDYRTPYVDNPSTNRTGESFSSKGTINLQRPDASSLFLYEDRTGNLSLVFLHGSVDNDSDGGSATLTITGLPEDGAWAVKDDEYDDETNYDNWRESDGVHRVDWTWGQGKTDGGAYTGLGDEFEITIDPAFNTEAALYGEYYNGAVRYWSALSAEDAAPEQRPLTAQPVTISSGGC
jgi:hypothetical protein